MLQAAIALANGDGAARRSPADRSAVPFECGGRSVAAVLRGLAYASTSGLRARRRSSSGTLIAQPGNQPTSLLHTLARLQLARAARDAGDPAQARQAYADFVGTWRDADPRHPLLAAAAREAAALPACRRVHRHLR